MHETGTHWDFSHQPMDPCTPPEFLKMASHGPSYIVHVYRCRTLRCGFSLLGQKNISVPSYWRRKYGRCMKQWAKVTTNKKERKGKETPHCVWPTPRGSPTVVKNCGTLHHSRVSSHLQFVYFGPNHVRRRHIVPGTSVSVGVHQWQRIQWDCPKIRNTTRVTS